MIEKSKFIIISNKFDKELKQFDFKRNKVNPYLTVYYKGSSCSLPEDGTILLDGYCLPQMNAPIIYQNLINLELVRRVIDEKVDIYSVIKGFFTIVIIQKEKVIIYGDHFGIKKFFYSEDFSVVSNDIFLFNKIFKCELLHINIAKFALFQHNIAGETFFKCVRHNRMGELLELGNRFLITTGWTPVELNNYNRLNKPVYDLAICLRKIIYDYIRLFNPRAVSLTLTGGRDTRTVLSALLSIGVKPNVFTFGYKGSSDVISANNISNKVGLNFANHDYVKSRDWYSTHVKEVIQSSSGLSHLHRAHRHAAIVSEAERVSELDMLFLGSMGGDFIKGVHLNDYIITEFIRLHYFQNNLSTKNITLILNKHFIKYTTELIMELDQFCKNLPFNNQNKKIVEFNLATEIIGHLHDSQDINIFMDHVQNVVVPFLDIDVLRMLFASNYNLFGYHRTSKNLFLQLKGGELQCEMIKILYPALADIPFASGYTPNDFLGNKFLYTIKRAYLRSFKRNNTSNFNYGEWFREYILWNYKQIHPNREFYDTNLIATSLNKIEHLSVEGYWHKYSNIVHINTLLEMLN